VKAGDEITIKDKPKSRQLVLRNLELTQIAPVPDWLTADRDALSGKVAHIPSREEMQPIVNEQLIVELYSRYAPTSCIPFIRSAPWIRDEIDETLFRLIVVRSMRKLLPILAVFASMLLSGCSPVVDAEFHNATGQPIVVTNLAQPEFHASIAAGGSAAVDVFVLRSGHAVGFSISSRGRAWVYRHHTRFLASVQRTGSVVHSNPSGFISVWIRAAGFTCFHNLALRPFSHQVFPFTPMSRKRPNQSLQPTALWRCASMSILTSIFSVEAKPRFPSGG
jgi:hypothetical protein